MDHVNILWASGTEYPQNWGIKPHRHPCYQLFYITAGKCTFTVDDTTFDAEQNGYVIVLPNEDHAMIKDHDTVVRMTDVKMEIPDETLAGEVSKLERPGQATETIGYLFKLIASEMSNTGAYNKEIIESYMHIILLKMMPRMDRESGLSFTGINEEGWPQVCRDIAQYIKSAYPRNLSLEDIAGHLGYNKNYICGIFKHHSGMTIMDYLMLVRIEHACELIQKSDYTFQQIGFMAGFNSVNHFYRVFKQHMNCSPGELRKRSIEKSGAVKQDSFANDDNYDVL